MTWFVLALIGIGAAVLLWRRAQANVFVHGGHAFKRRPDGVFVDASGATVVAGSALAMSLAAAHEIRRQHDRERSPGADSGGSGSSSSSGPHDCDSGFGGDGGSCGGDGGGGGD